MTLCLFSNCHEEVTLLLITIPHVKFRQSPGNKISAAVRLELRDCRTILLAGDRSFSHKMNLNGVTYSQNSVSQAGGLFQ